MEKPLTQLPRQKDQASVRTEAMEDSAGGIVALFEEEEAGLIRFAVGLVRRRELAEELVQDAFLRLHQHWEKVDQPRAWVYRAVRNLALNSLRKSQRETVEESSDERMGGSKEAPELLARFEAAGTLRLLMEELKPLEQQLVKLKYLEGLTYQEIGKRLEISTGNVGYQLHHILKGLGGRLREAGIEGSEG